MIKKNITTLFAAGVCLSMFSGAVYAANNDDAKSAAASHNTAVNAVNAKKKAIDEAHRKAYLEHVQAAKAANLKKFREHVSETSPGDIREDKHKAAVDAAHRKAYLEHVNATSPAAVQASEHRLAVKKAHYKAYLAHVKAVNAAKNKHNKTNNNKR